MAAKGSLAKEIVKEQILKIFEGSFIYSNGKEIRVPMEENGNLIQIKIQLSTAKEMVSAEGEVMKAAAVASESGPVPSISEPVKMVEPTEEEKNNIADLLKSLGLN